MPSRKTKKTKIKQKKKTSDINHNKKPINSNTEFNISDNIKNNEKAKELNPYQFLFIIIATIILSFFIYKIVDYYTAWGNTEKLIKRYIDKGENYAVHKQYHLAIKNFELAVSKAQKDEKYKEYLSQAKLSLAKTLKDAGEYVRAIDMYKKLIEEYKETNKDMYAWLLLELGDIYNSTYNTNDAIAIYKKIIKNFKGTDWEAEALFGIAESYKIKNDYKNAIDYFNKIVKKYKKGFLSAEALTNIGQIYEKEGKIEKAIKIYEKVVKNFPEIITEYARIRYNTLLKTVKKKIN